MYHTPVFELQCRFWDKLTLISSYFSPKRHCGFKMVNSTNRRALFCCYVRHQVGNAKKKTQLAGSLPPHPRNKLVIVDESTLLGPRDSSEKKTQTQTHTQNEECGLVNYIVCSLGLSLIFQFSCEQKKGDQTERPFWSNVSFLTTHPKNELSLVRNFRSCRLSRSGKLIWAYTHLSESSQAHSEKSRLHFLALRGKNLKKKTISPA